MSNELVVSTEINGDHWLVSAELSLNSTLPKEIFLYENQGDTSLDSTNFFGTCSVSDLTKFKAFTGTAIPVFGNRYIRYHQAKIRVDFLSDLDRVVTALVANVTSFKNAYSLLTKQTKVYTL